MPTGANCSRLADSAFRFAVPDRAQLSYVLITPARNEEAFIEKTIESVINQTFLPVKWVIVDDGSTDKTREIVSRYLVQYRWIEMVQMPQRRDRSFAAKVTAFNAGYEKVKGLPYEIIGSRYALAIAWL